MQLNLLLGGLRLVDGDRSVHHLGQADRPAMERDLAELEVGEVEQVVQEAIEALGVLVDYLQKRTRVLPILEPSFQEGLKVSLDRREGGAELMGDIGHELGPDRFEAAQLGDIVQHQDDSGCPLPALKGSG